MRLWFVATTALGVVAAGSWAAGSWAVAQSQAPVRLGPPPGGTVSYRIKADTMSGFGAGMMNARGGLGMIGAMMRDGMSDDASNRSLWLELGSNRTPAGAPNAEHLPPAGLGLGPSIPLVTPRPLVQGRPEPGDERDPERPEGRLMIFWGCGAATRPGQPVVIDFAKMYDQLSEQMKSMARMRSRQGMGGMPGMGGMGAMAGMGAGSAGSAGRGRYATIGEWPNDRMRRTVTARSSLVGDHVIKGNYSPEIRFTMAPDQDFLAPMRFTQSGKTPLGAMALAWNQVPNALGYFLTAVGGGEDKTMVIWTSSEVQDGQQPDDFASADQVARLVQAKTVLAPATTQCAIPTEAARRMGQGGVLSAIAYGPTHSFSYPPRPPKALPSWAPDWVTRVATRSTYFTFLGMRDQMREDGDPTGGEGAGEGGARPKPKKKRNPFGLPMPF